MHQINFDKPSGHKATIHVDNPNLPANSNCRPQPKRQEDGEWIPCRFLPEANTFLTLDGERYRVSYCRNCM